MQNKASEKKRDAARGEKLELRRQLLHERVEKRENSLVRRSFFARVLSSWLSEPFSMP
jgi:hypothetical protein